MHEYQDYAGKGLRTVQLSLLWGRASNRERYLSLQLTKWALAAKEKFDAADREEELEEDGPASGKVSNHSDLDYGEDYEDVRMILRMMPPTLHTARMILRHQG